MKTEPRHALWLKRLWNAGRELTQGLLHLVYPATCAVCGNPAPPERPNLCDGCRIALLHDPHPTCPRCAATVGPFVPLDAGCVHCRDERFHFERVLRLGPYDGLLREAILRMKHRSGEMLAEIVGDLWAAHAEQRLRDTGADVVVPVPLHWWRRWTRGYNQSAALAHALAARLRLPCRPGWLRRVRYTPKQTLQTPTARRANVQDAFQSRQRAQLRGRTVLLLDDVLTTGTTASEAARALKQAGAGRVVVAVLARGHG